MIRRPARGRRIDPFKGHLGQIERVDKNVDHTNRIALADPVFHAFRKQRALPTIDAFDEALHPIPLNRAGIVTRESPQAACFYTARVMSGYDRAEQILSALPLAPALERTFQKRR